MYSISNKFNFRALSDAKIVVLTVGFKDIEKKLRKIVYKPYIAIGFEFMCHNHGKNYLKMGFLEFEYVPARKHEF